jgi:hypothetical protein
VYFQQDIAGGSEFLLSCDGLVARMGWVYFIARTKDGPVSWVTRKWEGKRHPPETENDIKINLLPFIFTEKESSVLHHHRHWRVWVEELSTYDIELTISRSTLVFERFSGIQRFTNLFHVYDESRIVS